MPSTPGNDEIQVLIGGYTQTPGYLIRRANQAHTQLWAEAVPADVTGSQYAILAALASHGDLDQATVGRITSLDRSTVAELSARMTSRGLIERRRDLRDARRRLLHLTAEGARTVAEAAPAVHQLGERLLAPLDEAERARFMDMLRRVADAASPPSRR